MKNTSILYLIFLALHLSFIPDLYAQSWTFIKERDHVKLYTRIEGKGPLKSFRGEMDISADVDKINSMIGNPRDVKWWGESVKGIRVLLFEKEKHIRYYFIYKAPWPFTDRDLVTDAVITNDPVTGIRTIFSQPVAGVIPVDPDMIRLIHYWEKWTIQPLGNGMVHVALEGYIDPAGAIPAWLYNMVVVETPLKLMREVQKRVKSK